MKKVIQRVRGKIHNDIYARIDELKNTSYNDIYQQAVKNEKEKRRIEHDNIPRISLERKHFTNLKYLLDRYELLTLMPKSAVCAEIGVANGNYSRDILYITEPKKFHLIDAWISNRYNENLMENVMSVFSLQIQEGTVQINRGLSTEVLERFENEYFDWVYLDTDHRYALTKAELLLCNEKVKRGGIISGHDFCMGNWVNGYKYGVIEAVDEFCVTNNWEIIYITSEIENPSFALRRLK